ncbi:DNA-directed RNA polymerase subunit omega [Thermohalobacter berrensis]|uniref:DNA-directed RNA polymerase subunit omega n=1 Tax=Thermohalobacter berrensis TaxID=99594 RepID=A0A419TA69_9FIRM|nr:DNA-directed RNA polymerase subunit omega [Thermohalobacter berrensis]RKD34358.1 DNA-directed RNA polymerase subunit omega [Thermohalobacter berrensis]
MLYPSINDLLKKVDSRYSLVMVVSKRARQLVDGEEALVDVDTNKSVTKAIHEVADGKIEYEKPNVNGYK